MVIRCQVTSSKEVSGKTPAEMSGCRKTILVQAKPSSQDWIF